jgi:hypothetical protein
MATKKKQTTNSDLMSALHKIVKKHEFLGTITVKKATKATMTDDCEDCPDGTVPTTIQIKHPDGTIEIKCVCHKVE